MLVNGKPEFDEFNLTVAVLESLTQNDLAVRLCLGLVKVSISWSVSPRWARMKAEQMLLSIKMNLLALPHS